jgi:hypothetical protein
MGRPLNKRWFGALDNADDTILAPKNDTFYNITINVQVAANAESVQGLILSQKSSNKFRVNDAKDRSGNEGICTLVDKAAGSLAANEMSIDAFVTGTDGNQVRIKNYITVLAETLIITDTLGKYKKIQL